jgi:hypothetical protein
MQRRAYAKSERLGNRGPGPPRRGPREAPAIDLIVALLRWRKTVLEQRIEPARYDATLSLALDGITVALEALESMSRA